MRLSLRGRPGRVVPAALAVLAPVLTLSLTLSLTACEVDRSVVHVLLADAASPRWSEVGLPAFEDRVEERCEGCVVTVSSAGGDAGRQADQFAQALEDADVVVLDAVDPEAAEEYVGSAGEAPVVAWDRLVPGADYFVGAEPGAVGEVLAGAVRRTRNQSADPGGRVLLLDAPAGDSDAAAVVAEARSGLPGDVEVATAEDAARARQVVAQRVDAAAYSTVLTSTDEQAAGATEALAGREDAPAVVGPDASLPTARRIVGGSQAASAYVPWHHLGTQVADVVVPLMTGGQPRGGEEVEGVRSWVVTPRGVTLESLTGTMVRDGAIGLDELCTGALRRRCTTLGLV